MPAIAGNGQIGFDVDRPIRCHRAHAGDGLAATDQIDGFRIHHHLERGEALAGLTQEIQEVPLRHEGNERVLGAEPAEIGDPHGRAAKQAVHHLQALVRQLQEPIDQAELVHHLERRGMHGVAAKVAEEIRMPLQHHDVDAGASQEIAEHHAGRPAADDATSGSHGVTHGVLWGIRFRHQLLAYNFSTLCGATSRNWFAAMPNGR